MSIREMEDRHRELREKFVAGAISRAIFEAQVAKLRYQDARGRYWAIGWQTGRWHVYEDGRWRLDKPMPPADPTCVYCGQLLPPQSDTCVLCGRRVSAPPPPPPPVDTGPAVPGVSALSAKRRRLPLLALGRGIAGLLLLLACSFILFDGWLIYTKAKPPWTWLPTETSVVVASSATPTSPAATPEPEGPSSTPGPTSTPTTTLVVQATYESAAQGFQLRYPAGWARDEQRDRVAFAAHQDDLDGKNLVDGRVFVVETNAVTATAPQVALGKLVDTLPGQDVLVGKIQTDTLDTEPAANVLVSFTPAGESIALKMYVLVARHEARLYTVRAMAPAERWKATWPAYQEMLRSFRFVERPATPTTRPPASPTATPTHTARPPQTSSPPETRTGGQTATSTSATRTPSPPPTVVSGYPFMGDGDVKISEPKCGQPFKVRGRISGLDEWAGRILVKVRYPGGAVEDFPEAVRADGTYLIPTLTARGGEYLIWLEDRTNGERLSDHLQFSGVDPCQSTVYEVNWKRRK